jgi:hypothetical protein
MGLPRAEQDLHKILTTNGSQRSGQIRESFTGFEPLPDALRFTASVESGAVRWRYVQGIGEPRPVYKQPVTDIDLDFARVPHCLAAEPLACLL